MRVFGRAPVRLSLGLIALLAPLAAAASASAGPRYTSLDPGGPVNMSETVPVQFVFVGYEPAQVDREAFLDELPTIYKPVVRSRLWYGVTERLGLHYSYDYKILYAEAAYENAFFGALSRLAKPAARTLFQDLYNAQEGNVLDVGQNHFIDAPSVERWLFQHPPAGVDPTRNTVFFVNWWGRADFKFHVYTKFGEPDPDTGFDFGVNRASRKVIAWGGTPPDDEETGFGGASRLWFYDLSAGPESWTDNWNVDDADVDGDGRADYRMPPVWEYGSYRPAAALAGDLGKVARYAAINLLFTPSPLYPPYITPERQPGSLNLDLNTYEGWRGVDASERYQVPSLLEAEIEDVHRVPYTRDKQDLALAGQAKQCFVLFPTTNCYPDRPQYGPTGWPNLFLYNALNIGATWDGGAEYEAMFFNYAADDPQQDCCLGYADDNWLDGTQSFTFNFVSPGIVAAGYGLTTTQIHEYGHHFGMSHPHDGYDYETGRDYGPGGDLYFAWSGDEVNSMMSYIDLNWDYSQFDRDNANRFQAAAYVRSANLIAEDILASPNAKAAGRDLRLADDEIGLAKMAFAAHDYVATFDAAKRAYEYVRAGAAKAGVAVEASEAGWTVLPPVRAKPAKRTYSFVDRYGPGTQRGKP